MSYPGALQPGGDDRQQRPFSFQIPSEHPNAHAQHANGQLQTAQVSSTRPPSSFERAWSGYPEQRFSYQDTPIDDNTQTFDDERQAAVLEEARQRYGDDLSNPTQPQQNLQQQAPPPPINPPEYPPEKQQVQRMPSAYQLAPPAEPHPAHYAPVSQPTPPVPASMLPTPSQQTLPPQDFYASPPPHSPGPLPLKTQVDPHQAAHPSPPPPPPSQTSQARLHPNPSDTPTFSSPATFSTYTNNLPDLDAQHRPGQITHPSMKTSKTGRGGVPQPNPSTAHFHHSLCSCPGADLSTCMTGLFCPCILYSRLTYRLGQRSRKQDPTDVLGFHKCNGHCMAFATLCSCGISGFLAGIARGRVRHAYDLEGDAVSDCIEGCCCCCCAIIQSEREVRIREEQKSRWAGPSTVVDLDPYKRTDNMRYPATTNS
ncbi:MAG: hypothetical protein Q9162_000851 [Coniocarpon cinnabarinum]